jgi:hypothetical protein
MLLPMPLPESPISPGDAHPVTSTDNASETPIRTAERIRNFLICNLLLVLGVSSREQLTPRATTVRTRLKKRPQCGLYGRRQCRRAVTLLSITMVNPCLFQYVDLFLRSFTFVASATAQIQARVPLSALKTAASGRSLSRAPHGVPCVLREPRPLRMASGHRVVRRTTTPPQLTRFNCPSSARQSTVVPVVFTGSSAVR